MRQYIFFITILLIWAIMGCGGKDIDEYSVITFVIGDVKKNNIDAQIGDLVKENDVIVTAEKSFCDIKIGESIIRIKARSEMSVSQLLKNGELEATTLGLSSGSMLCKPKKLVKSESFLVKTPTAVAGIRGTQFAIETDKVLTTRIKVFEGEVKAAKRIKQFEESVESILEISPEIKGKEQVIITLDEVKEAESVVENALKKETAKGGTNDEIMERVISNTKGSIVINRSDIENFSADDFIREIGEIFAVEKKSPEEITLIVEVIKEEKAKPQPEGRLLVTRYDVYFIKHGKILWEGKLVSGPVKDGNKLFVASGEYVFCAMVDGPVLWKQSIKNDGMLSFVNGKIIVKAEGKDINLNPETGERL
ncbi:MAG: FecR domain-containing protein [Spirochaetota bacterium]